MGKMHFCILYRDSDDGILQKIATPENSLKLSCKQLFIMVMNLYSGNRKTHRRARERKRRA
jgi:hypothetical protein